MKVNLVVLYCADLDFSRKFYESLGLRFEREQHGKGPVHFAAMIGDVVLELYPESESAGATSANRARIGFQIDSIEANALPNSIGDAKRKNNGRLVILEDPDGHRVHLSSASDT